MLYTNYKQIAKIILKSEDAVSTTDSIFQTIDQNGANFTTRVIRSYTYNVHLPFYKFNKNTKMAVDTFSIDVPEGLYTYSAIGDLYVKNLKKNEVYHSGPTSSNGTCLLSVVMGKSNQYINPDLINNSIEITGNTHFLEQYNPLEIFVDTKIQDFTLVNGVASLKDIKGCPENVDWSLTLYIFEEEKEENKKDFVSDSRVNFSKPSLY